MTEQRYTPSTDEVRDTLAEELIDAGWDDGPHLSTAEARKWSDRMLESGRLEYALQSRLLPSDNPVGHPVARSSEMFPTRGNGGRK